MSVFQQFEDNKNKIEIYTHKNGTSQKTVRKYNGKNC